MYVNKFSGIQPDSQRIQIVEETKSDMQLFEMNSNMSPNAGFTGEHTKIAAYSLHIVMLHTAADSGSFGRDS